MPSKDCSETRTMHSKSNNIEVLTGNETDEIIEELFDSLLQKYQKGLEESVKRSVDLLYYKLYKISLNRSGSYINSRTWLKNKKATINPKSNDDECFQYAVIVALNYLNIKHNPERISKIKPFFNHYNWK